MAEDTGCVPARPGTLAGKRVLVVEDEATIRESVSQFLRWEGCEVIMAADGSEALTQAQLNLPDVIILDLGLPSADPGGGQFDGFGVMKWLDFRLPKRIPVIVLTARQDEATRRQAEGLGAHAFIAKPFEPSELTAAVGRALNGPNAGQ